MFGRSKSVAFDAYGSRRKRRLLPGWVWVLLIGVLMGVAGVLYVQENHLPERLSAQASERLQTMYTEADAQRRQLTEDLTRAREEAAQARADERRLVEQLQASHETRAQLREEIDSIVGALPPDPRGGEVEVRAARFVNRDAVLHYDIVLTNDRPADRPQQGVVQFMVAGVTPRGVETTIPLDPIRVRVGGYTNVRGSVALPEDFNPRQTTILVLDRPDGRRLGMRVMLVRGRD